MLNRINWKEWESEWAKKKMCSTNFKKKQQHSTRIQRHGMFGLKCDFCVQRQHSSFGVDSVRVCVCVPATLLDWIGFSWLCSSSFLCPMQMEKFFITSLCNVHGIHSRWQFILFYSIWFFLSLSLFLLKSDWKSCKIAHTFIERKLCTEWICHCHCHKSHICVCVSSIVFNSHSTLIRASGLFPFIRLIRSHFFFFVVIWKAAKCQNLSNELLWLCNGNDVFAESIRFIFLLCFFLHAAKAKTMSNSKTNGYYEAYGYISFH